MSDLVFGLLCWLGVAVVASVLIGRFMREPEPGELPESARAKSGLYMLPGYGWEEEEMRTQAATQPRNHSESDRSPQ